MSEIQTIINNIEKLSINEINKLKIDEINKLEFDNLFNFGYKMVKCNQCDRYAYDINENQLCFKCLENF